MLIYIGDLIYYENTPLFILKILQVVVQLFQHVEQLLQHVE